MNIDDLRRVKEQERMTGEEIAELSGIPLDIVNRIFSGEIKEPNYMSLLAMEQVIVRKKKIPFYYDDEQQQLCLIREQVAYNFDARRYLIEDIGQLSEGLLVELIVEIVSPGNSFHDYVTKLIKYQQAGVREYWIVDPRTECVSVIFFEDAEKNAEYKYDDIIASRVLEGFEIRIADFINQFQN